MLLIYPKVRMTYEKTFIKTDGSIDFFYFFFQLVCPDFAERPDGK
jgi:hypothetical protein